jgi:hypothetical protein
LCEVQQPEEDADDDDDDQREAMLARFVTPRVTESVGQQ